MQGLFCTLAMVAYMVPLSEIHEKRPTRPYAVRLLSYGARGRARATQAVAGRKHALWSTFSQVSTHSLLSHGWRRVRPSPSRARAASAGVVTALHGADLC